jgi:hypothetical protein
MRVEVTPVAIRDVLVREPLLGDREVPIQEPFGFGLDFGEQSDIGSGRQGLNVPSKEVSLS